MIASANSHRRENVVADRKEQQSPPGKKVGDERKRNQQVKKGDRNNIGPKHFAIRVDSLRSRNARLVEPFCFDMNVFGNRICLGRCVRGVVEFGLSFSSHGFFIQIVREQGASEKDRNLV